MKQWLGAYGGFVVGVLACGGLLYYWWTKNYGEPEGE